MKPTADCPCCFGSGQITGPDSAAFHADPTDPFNVTVRLCDECEGTGIVTAVRAAGLMARAMDQTYAVIDKVLPELAAGAAEQAERHMQALGLTDERRKEP